MRRTGQTFRLLLKALLLASEEKQDIIIVVNKEDYGSSLIRKLYGIIKEHLGDFVENNYNKITLGNGSTITGISYELYHKRCSQGVFRGKPQPQVLFDGSCDEVFTDSYKRGDK